jgi:conjugal transfer mating pair stabilization protein TraN
MENTRTYCCYNSLLAKIIEEQGRVQIGKGYGNVQSPDCSGLTTAQFSQIDFSKIDLSAFTASIMASINMNNIPGTNTTGINNNANNVIQNKIQNYYNNGHQ